MANNEEKIKERLFELQDTEYRDFQRRLMPTVEPLVVIGVRTPHLRKLAAELCKTPEAEEFLRDLPHRYYEENNLHAFLLERENDFTRALEAVEAFLPYVDNWATCDQLSPRAFKKHPAELLESIKVWLASDKTYTVRFGIGMLMRYYLDEQFKPEYPELAAHVESCEYYINMMKAWYFATALAKQYDSILPYFKLGRLDVWTHNKAIQKAVESYRISDEKKVYLRTLKIK